MPSSRRSPERKRQATREVVVSPSARAAPRPRVAERSLLASRHVLPRRLHRRLHFWRRRRGRFCFCRLRRRFCFCRQSRIVRFLGHAFGLYADFEKFDSKSQWAAQRRKFFKTAVGARLLAIYHPHSDGPPTSLSLFKTMRPRRTLRQMPTKSPPSRRTAHATADAHVRCLPSPQTHSLGKILKNGSGRQEKSQLELEK